MVDELWGGDVLLPRLVAFAEGEANASVIKAFGSDFVPSYLQTERYAGAVLRSLFPHRTPVVVDRLIEFRMARQWHLFERATPPSIEVVLDEAVLHRAIGGRSILTGSYRDSSSPSCRAVWQLQTPFPDRDALRDSGTRLKYSNLGYALIGQVIEAVSDQAYADYVTTHIADPIGLSTMTVDAPIVQMTRGIFGVLNHFETNEEEQTRAERARFSNLWETMEIVATNERIVCINPDRCVLTIIAPRSSVNDGRALQPSAHEGTWIAR